VNACAQRVLQLAHQPQRARGVLQIDHLARVAQLQAVEARERERLREQVVRSKRSASSGCASW
jgi:hypothetical protein